MCLMRLWSSNKEASLSFLEKIIKFIKSLPKGIDKFFKSRTIDSEHIIGIIYAFLYLLPFMINKLVFAIVNWIFSYLPLSIMTIPLTMFVINLSLFIYYVKTIVRLFKERRILLGIIIFYLVFSFLLGSIFWFGSIFLGLTVTTVLLFPNSIQSHELLNMMNRNSQNYWSMSDSFENYARIGVPIIQFLGLSYFLNLFVPSKYQSVDISIKERFIRIFIKVVYLLLPIIFFLIFSKVDKDSYTVIAGIGLVIIWFSTPQNIISLLNRSIIIKEEDVKPEVVNRIKILQLLLFFIEISWGISIYFFAKYSAIDRLFITLGILSMALILLIVWQKYKKVHQKEWIKNTLKEGSAQKILNEIEVNRTKGEN